MVKNSLADEGNADDMEERSQKDVETSDLQASCKSKDRFPRIVIIIVVAEFCERFSYSGMKAFLALYLKSKLMFSDDEATEMYHTFTCLIYFFPILGAIIADSYLGKFRTILYMMFVYAAGNMVVAVAAIPQLALPGRLCTSIGLLLISLGAGGIKPCVSAFGGDQFEMPRQEKHLSVYFMMLYFTLCFGSLIAKTVSPILRSEIHCFGDKDCYSVAFGAPGMIMILSIVIFAGAKRLYVRKKPTGNVVMDVIKCIAVIVTNHSKRTVDTITEANHSISIPNFVHIQITALLAQLNSQATVAVMIFIMAVSAIKLGLKNKMGGRKSNLEKDSHWLDSTNDLYDKPFITDIKKTLSILMLYIPLPVFWALLDQMGSRWTLQATRMNGDFGWFTVKPDQMQVIAPIIILIVIPLFQKVVYPCFDKLHILRNPLHKLTLGGVLAGMAFVVSGYIELHLQKTYPQMPQPNFSQMRIFNGYPCALTITNPLENITSTISPYSVYVDKAVRVDGLRNISLELRGDCAMARRGVFLLEEGAAVSFYVSDAGIVRYIEEVQKSRSGYPLVRFLTSGLSNSKATLFNEKRRDNELVITEDGASTLHEIFPSSYAILINNLTIRSRLKLAGGGVYTIILGKPDNDTHNSGVMTVTEANSVSMALLLPQFIIISVAEVFFAVTGTEFSFKEAPQSMKSVLQASWLLTEAFGNVLIIVVTRLGANYGQATRAFIYTGLILFAMVIFYFLAENYKFTSEMSPTYRKTSPEPRETRANSEVLYMHVRQCEEFVDH